jgi:hypothetical protein
MTAMVFIGSSYPGFTEGQDIRLELDIRIAQVAVLRALVAARLVEPRPSEVAFAHVQADGSGLPFVADDALGLVEERPCETPAVQGWIAATSRKVRLRSSLTITWGILRA